LFQKHAESGDILLITQVLQEFYVAVTRKLARPLDAAAAAVARKSVCLLGSQPNSRLTRGLVCGVTRSTQACP